MESGAQSFVFSLVLVLVGFISYSAMFHCVFFLPMTSLSICASAQDVVRYFESLHTACVNSTSFDAMLSGTSATLVPGGWATSKWE